MKSKTLGIILPLNLLFINYFKLLGKNKFYIFSKTYFVTFLKNRAEREILLTLILSAYQVISSKISLEIIIRTPSDTVFILTS